MKKLALVLTVVLASGALLAQGGGGPGGQGGGGGGGQGGPGGQGGAGRGRNDNTAKREDKPQGGGQGQGGADYWKKRQQEAIEALGWGENGDETRVEPGQTTPDKDKETWLETESVKLGLEDKKLKADFKRLGLKIWRETETEDQRYAATYKSMKDLKDCDTRMEEPKKKHLEALKKMWEKSDAEMTKKKVLTEDQMKVWQEDTKKMREQTATDKSYEQDKIRARKIEELKKQWANWGKEENKEDPDKKAKKKEETEEEKKEPEKK